MSIHNLKTLIDGIINCVDQNGYQIVLFVMKRHITLR